MKKEKEKLRQTTEVPSKNFNIGLVFEISFPTGIHNFLKILKNWGLSQDHTTIFFKIFIVKIIFKIGPRTPIL